MMGRLLVVAALLAGCRQTGSFACDRDEMCRRGGVTGICGLQGFCAFEDGMCPSGFRYDETAAGYAGTCVSTDELPDAAIDTAPPFDVATCPATYNVTIASTMGTSRYRLNVAQATFWTHAANCEDDVAGATHLVIPNTAQELVDLSRYIDPLANTGALFYVAAVQMPSAATHGEGWILYDDTPVPPEVWQPGNPDDDDLLENREEQLAVFDKSAAVRRMSDVGGDSLRGAVCECDGTKVGPMYTAAVASDPNKP